MKFRAIAAGAAVAAALLLAPTSKASAETVTQQAAQIKTMAQFNAASPAVKAEIDHVTHWVYTVTVHPAYSFERPNYPDTGCTGWDETYSKNGENLFGWVLISSQISIFNYCIGDIFGHWIIYTTPYAIFTQNSHWGYMTCGIEGAVEGMVAPLWEFYAADVAAFEAGTCTYPLEEKINGAVEVYGNGWSAQQWSFS